jgi:hypothetical protein
MIVGVTGTRRGLPPLQFSSLRVTLERLRTSGGSELHHGDCVGADAAAHQMWVGLGGRVVVHPPENPAARAFCDGVVLPPRPFMARNHDIVRACSVLVAAPASSQETLRSGTWATVRYARRRDCTILLVLPTGHVAVDRVAAPAQLSLF